MKLAVIDTETTGVDITKDAPVQISAITVVPGEAPEVLFDVLCNPGRPIPQEASNVHKVTDEMVAGKPAAEAMAMWAEQMVAWSQADVLVSFNGKTFDIPLLQRYCAGQTLDLWGSLPHLDVLDVAYRFFPAMDNHRLGTIYKALFGQSAEQAHNAIADVAYTYHVLDALRVKIGMTYEQLIEEMKEPKVYTVLPIGKYKGTVWQDVPKGWANYLLKVNEEKMNLMRADLRVTLEAIVAR